MGGCSSRTGQKEVSDCCMCEAKDRESSIDRRIVFPIKPPAGFLSSQSTKKNPAVRQNKKEESKGQQTSEDGKRETMSRLLTVMSAGTRNSNNASPEPEKNRRSNGGSRRSSWIEVPDPLPGWTIEEQDAFLSILNEYPKAGRDNTQLELAVVKALKRIPTKTNSDLHQCFKHIDASRIAYFGRVSHTR